MDKLKTYIFSLDGCNICNLLTTRHVKRDRNQNQNYNTMIYSVESAITNAKKIFGILSKEYNINIPLVFKKLNGRGSGYIETTHRKGYPKQKIIHRIVIDSSDMGCFDPDYIICHEFAHAVLIQKKGSTHHSKEHNNLTYKFAKRFNLT